MTYVGDPELEEEVAGMSSAEVSKLRQLCKEDLFFLCRGILGFNDVSEDAHGALCRFTVEENRQRRLTLMSRGHLKSTICTVADSIRLPLIDPNIRILIINETATNAIGFLTEIKAHWVQNILLRKLFPELVPEKFTGPGSWWSQDQACLNRRSTAKEPTWSALGVGGAAVSRHFNRIKADDLIGEAAKESENVMKSTIQWNRSIQPLLTRHTEDSTDKIDWIGTRKGLYDLYSVLMDQYEDLAIFSREPIEDGKPILPSMFSMKMFEEIMSKTPDIWAADYMNNPLGQGMQEWGLTANKFFDVIGSRVIFQNLAGELLAWELADLDIVIILDPNDGRPTAPDKAAVVCVGTSPADDVFVLESTSGRWSPDGLLDIGFRMADRWKPRVVGLEKAGQQNTKYYWDKRCKDRSIFYSTMDLKHGNIEKATRIRTALDTPVKENRLYIRREQLVLRDRLFRFPQIAPHQWDELDALAYYPQLARPGFSQVEGVKQKEVRKRILSMRGRTGYGGSIRGKW